MVALVVVSTFVVLLLGILVAGLLRSHADILRSLHELGVGVEDPATAPRHPSTSEVSPPIAELPMGPSPTVAGVTPSGDARAVSVTNHDHLTLLGFLSSGCTTCASFWRALQSPERLGFPGDVRVVIVTKGPEMEVPSEVRSMTTGRIPVVMSTEAWLDYQVPGSPFFVLVDGASGRRVGQGVANEVRQLAELVRRAEHDRGHEASRQDGWTGLNGPAREAATDDVLRAAGIEPGDPSLYPKTLEDVFPDRRATWSEPDPAVRAD